MAMTCRLTFMSARRRNIQIVIVKNVNTGQNDWRWKYFGSGAQVVCFPLWREWSLIRRIRPTWSCPTGSPVIFHFSFDLTYYFVGTKYLDMTDRPVKKPKLENVHINTIKPLIPPACVLEELPATEKVQQVVRDTRKTIGNILHGKDDRVCMAFFSQLIELFI